jgi:hypothetical protein
MDVGKIIQLTDKPDPYRPEKERKHQTPKNWPWVVDPDGWAATVQGNLKAEKARQKEQKQTWEAMKLFPRLAALEIAVDVLMDEALNPSEASYAAIERLGGNTEAIFETVVALRFIADQIEALRDRLKLDTDDHGFDDFDKAGV